MGAGWTVRHALQEAVGHLAGATVRTGLLLAAFATAFGALAWAELDVTGDLIDQAAHVRARGGDVAVVTAREGEALDAATCEALGAAPHVVAAGGVRPAGTVRFTSAPDVEFTLAEATPAMVAVWDPAARAPARAGWVLGRAAATELGVRGGSLLAADGIDPRPVTVIDPADRDRFADRSVVSLIPPAGEVGGCWVELRPGAAPGGRAALHAAFPGVEVDVRPLLRLDEEFAADPGAGLAQRPQRHLWLPAAALLAVVSAVVAFTRRSEGAVYRAFGLPRAGVLVMRQIETGLLGLAGFAAGVAWAAAAYGLLHGPPEPDQLAIAVATAARALLALVAAGPWLAALAGAGSPATLLKDR